VSKYETPPIVSIVLLMDMVLSAACASTTAIMGASYVWFFIYVGITTISVINYMLFLSIEIESGGDE